MNHILVALDFSDYAEVVLAKAVQLARAMEGSLTILHVAAPEPGFVGLEVGPQSVRDSRARVLEKEHQELHRMAEEVKAAGVDARAFLFAGPTSEKILQEAAKLRVDWIVMGTHGRSAIATALLGSVSSAVLHGATCPVVIVPAAK
ncbi:MAG: nucleotide-binding universal stress UspA family protein [Hyphomicrobiaceae bacterium]|jgi:nucleotide-binding universal stress UspA family protein